MNTIYYTQMDSPLLQIYTIHFAVVTNWQEMISAGLTTFVLQLKKKEEEEKDNNKKRHQTTVLHTWIVTLCTRSCLRWWSNDIMFEVARIQTCRCLFCWTLRPHAETIET